MGKNNMTFYQAMQLGAERLKPMIKNEEDKKTIRNNLCSYYIILY